PPPQPSAACSQILDARILRGMRSNLTVGGTDGQVADGGHWLGDRRASSGPCGQLRPVVGSGQTVLATWLYALRLAASSGLAPGSLPLYGSRLVRTPHPLRCRLWLAHPLTRYGPGSASDGVGAAGYLPLAVSSARRSPTRSWAGGCGGWAGDVGGKGYL